MPKGFPECFCDFAESGCGKHRRLAWFHHALHAFGFFHWPTDPGSDRVIVCETARRLPEHGAVNILQLLNPELRLRLPKLFRRTLNPQSGRVPELKNEWLKV